MADICAFRTTHVFGGHGWSEVTVSSRFVAAWTRWAVSGEQCSPEVKGWALKRLADVAVGLKDSIAKYPTFDRTKGVLCTVKRVEWDVSQHQGSESSLRLLVDELQAMAVRAIASANPW